ncbi:Glutathione S-transferase 7 [Chytridiales sp. JEL 0842]|nr:Glutathione S-transferase 7 [Chytridiales sp. JEL 0842]
MSKADIQLYLAGTPNGKKIPIVLEELGIEYDINLINFGKEEQFTPEFLKISPNNKIPAIVDLHPPFSPDKEISVFESGAIVKYLAEHKAGKPNNLYPSDPRARVATDEWVNWQVAGLGPMMGQMGFFTKFSKEKVQVGIDRYTNEVKRLFNVMETRLSKVEYFNGHDFSIADAVIYPWAFAHAWLEFDITPYPHVKKWLDKVGERPAVKKALAKVDAAIEASKKE